MADVVVVVVVVAVVAAVASLLECWELRLEVNEGAGEEEERRLWTSMCVFLE